MSADIEFDAWQRNHFASIMAHMRAAGNNDPVLSGMIQSAIKGAWLAARATPSPAPIQQTPDEQRERLWEAISALVRTSEDLMSDLPANGAKRRQIEAQEELEVVINDLFAVPAGQELAQQDSCNAALRPAPAGQHDAKTSILDEPKIGQTVKARIKRGAVIWQDMRSMKWPVCLAPGGCNVDLEMVFDAVWNGEYWDCTAHGYGKHGQPGSYGNGSIFVSGADDVHIVDPSAEAQVPAGTAGDTKPGSENSRAPTVKASQ